MPRPPVARKRILQAARTIVERAGAGALTYEELAKVSGVTRGGITYHFPTKDALLRTLLDDDIAQWDASEQALRPEAADCSCPHEADLIAQIRSHACQDESRKRFVAGILSAAVHQPELLDACRAQNQQEIDATEWTDTALRAHLLRLAASGLFWDDVFQMRSLPAEVRRRLIEMMEGLAREWVKPCENNDKNR